MISPYAVDVPMVRYPIANWVLIAVTFLFSLAVLNGFWPAQPDPAPVWRGPNGVQRFQFQPPKTPEERIRPFALMPHRLAPRHFVTHLLVHTEIFHLVGNMMFLFVFGNAVNAKLGHVLYLASYFGLGAVAGAFWILTGDGAPLVGASGAIMGVVGIFLVLFPRNDVHVYVQGFDFSFSSFWLIGFYFVGDLCGMLLFGNGPIAYIADLAGALSGAAWAVILVGYGWIVSERYEENLLQVLGIGSTKPATTE